MNVLNKIHSLFGPSASKTATTNLVSTAEERRQEAQEVRASKPNVVPVIIEEHRDVNYVRYMQSILPCDCTVRDVISIIRDSNPLAEGTAVICSVQGDKPGGSETIHRLYTSYPTYDGHLHLTINYISVRPENGNVRKDTQ